MRGRVGRRGGTEWDSKREKKRERWAETERGNRGERGT